MRCPLCNYTYGPELTARVGEPASCAVCQVRTTDGQRAGALLGKRIDAHYMDSD